MGREPGDDIARFVEGLVIDDEAGDLLFAADGDEFLLIERILHVFKRYLFVDPLEVVHNFVAVVAPRCVVEVKRRLFDESILRGIETLVSMSRKATPETDE